MNNFFNTLLLIIFIGLTTAQIRAQVVIAPLKGNPILIKAIDERRAQNHERSAAIDLPFYDDFSYDGPYTDLSLWEGDDVYVNTHFALNNPTIGVATFDGLDGAGQPYGGGHGPSDVLTSQPIDLSGLTAADNVNFSFFVEPGGLGYAPTLDDKLMVEFKKADGTWDEISTYAPTAIDVFGFKLFSISSVNYLHDDFQFRFTNECSRQGLGEVWHLDYVRVQKNVLGQETFEDIAFTQIPANLLTTYTAIPKDHFQGNEAAYLNDQMNINIFNHFGVTNDVQAGSFRVKELNENTTLHNVGLLNGSQADIPSGALTSFDNPVLSYTDLVSSIQGVSNGVDSLLLETSYRFSVGEEDASNPSVFGNNTVRRYTTIDGHYAYDDGSAEAGITCGNPNNQIAVRYTSLKNGMLHAVGMHIPYITNDIDNQTFILKVWIGELDDTPEYSGMQLSPVQLGYTQLDGFNPYILMDEFGLVREPLDIPAGDFYIGWQQITSSTLDKIPVGLDYNTDASDECYFSASTTAEWISFGAQFDGSLMIRPYFEAPIVVSNTNIATLSDQVTIYPNPTAQSLTIEGLEDFSDIHIQVLDLSGRTIMTTTQTRFDLPSDMVGGLYLLKIQSEAGTAVKKFIKQ